MFCREENPSLYALLPSSLCHSSHRDVELGSCSLVTPKLACIPSGLPGRASCHYQLLAVPSLSRSSEGRSVHQSCTDRPRESDHILPGHLAKVPESACPHLRVSTGSPCWCWGLRETKNWWVAGVSPQNLKVLFCYNLQEDRSTESLVGNRTRAMASGCLGPWPCSLP